MNNTNKRKRLKRLNSPEPPPLLNQQDDGDQENEEASRVDDVSQEAAPSSWLKGPQLVENGQTRSFTNMYNGQSIADNLSELNDQQRRDEKMTG